jgi:hypothetical protein
MLRLPRLLAHTVGWPLRAAGELRRLRAQLPAVQAAAAEAVRLSLEADGVPRETPR